MFLLVYFGGNVTNLTRGTNKAKIYAIDCGNYFLFFSFNSPIHLKY
jgi:hypothetical protein